jgi:hypothetical protein
MRLELNLKLCVKLQKTRRARGIQKATLKFFIYFLKLEENLVYDVLQTADLYLLPGLKRKCASELAINHLNKETLFDFLKISRLYDLKKLEFACIAFLAQNLLEVIN